MPRIVAFLRAINVGGHTVRMERLRELFQAIGLRDVETFIASGNVIFTTPAGNLDALQRKIERHLEKALGYEVKTFLRTDAEVEAVAAYQPFRASETKAALSLNVAFLAEPLTPAAVTTLDEFRSDADSFHVNGRELYWLCRKRQSESMFSNTRFEKRMKVSATFRGVNTVAKIAAKYPGASAGGPARATRKT